MSHVKCLACSKLRCGSYTYLLSSGSWGKEDASKGSFLASSCLAKQGTSHLESYPQTKPLRACLSISQRSGDTFTIATNLGRGVRGSPGLGAVGRQEAGRWFPPPCLPSLVWEGGCWQRGLEDTVGASLPCSGGKAGLGRPAYLGPKSASDTTEPGVLGQTTVLSEPQFLHL